MKVVAFPVAFFGGILGASYAAGLVALALAGCAGKASPDDESDQDLTAARPPVELASTEDASSVQATLYQMLKSFQSEAELGIFAPTDGNLLVLQGGREPRVQLRSVGCQETARIDPAALRPIVAHECTLTGFDAVRNGASLPPSLAAVASGSAPPLASRLFSLLGAAEQKGGFGVRRGGVKAGCCDQQSTTSFTVADAHSSLSCTSTSGGFVSITSVSCLYLRQDAVPPRVK